MSDKLTLINQLGAVTGDVEVTFLEREKGEQAVHDAVVAYLAGLRAGTACTKTRAEVRATGKKPYKQKGTGRARHGSLVSNIHTGGGVAFGPKPRSYAKGINKKVKRLAVRRAFTERVDAEEVIVVEDINFETAKTKNATQFLKDINAGERCVVVVSDILDEENLEKQIENLVNIELSFDNLPRVELISSTSVNTYDLLSGKKVVITKAALEDISARVAKETK